MEFSGVYHKTSEQMSYALDEDRLIVNIKTGYDVKQVFIHYGDPYEAGMDKNLFYIISCLDMM